MKIADRLLQLRKESGLTLRELSEKVGITAAALSSYEKGHKEPSLEFAIKLAKFYGKSLDNLCGIEDIAQEQSYADILMFILKISASIGGGLRYDNCGHIEGDGKEKLSDRYIEYQFDSHPKGIRFILNVSSSEVGSFFDTYVKLSMLARNGSIPQSVFIKWLKDALASEAKLPLAQEISEEEKQNEFVSDGREIGV